MDDSDLPLRNLIREMIKPDENLYGVVDAARDSYLASVAFSRFGISTYSLFRGELAPFLAHVAPHLVPIPLDSEYLKLWSERLGISAGILLLTEEEPALLLQHLRKTFEATDEDENEFFFRYFDPRVLRPYLPTCTRKEANEFFGPIRMILVEDEKPEWMLSCEAVQEGAKIKEVMLDSSHDVTSSEGIG